MMERPRLFDEQDDLSRFAPNPAPAPPPEHVRQVATAAGFLSREPQPTTPRPPREPYRYRTGRTEQFSARIKPEYYDRFYDIARAHGWKLGETVEKALEALEREIYQRNQTPNS
jgi:hypothetical protein